VTSLTVTGLTNGTGVTFQVDATTAVGTSAYSAYSARVVPLAAPDAPTVTTTTAGNGVATIGWTAGGTGGTPITRYAVRVLDASTGLQLGALRTMGTAGRSLTVTGLVNGTPVTLAVQAVTAFAAGPFSAASEAVTPITVPGAPVLGTATAGNASVVLGWSTPVDGGSPLTAYAVRVVDAKTNVQVGSVRPAASTTLAVTGLADGTAVKFQVQAVTAVGAGAYSAYSAAVTPVTSPRAPTAPTVTAGNASATVGWTASSTTGTVAVRYSVRVVNSTTHAQVGALRTVPLGATSVTVTGLVNGTGVQVQVAAAVGTATVYSTASAVVTPLTVPGAPAIGTAAASNTTALVRWTAPTTGGSPITGYTIRVLNAATGVQLGALLPAPAGATSRTVTGLVNELPVTFQVVATSAVGSGSYSPASKPVTPFTTAGAPGIGVAAPGAVGGTATASVGWTPPAGTGGSVVTGYVVTALRLDANGAVLARTVSAATAATTRTLSMSLLAGSYRFEVQARNAAGLGVASTRSALVVAR